MASAGAASTGLNELRHLVQGFPARVEAESRRIAETSAERIRAGAVERLRAQTRGSGASAAAITVRENAEARAFEVTMAPGAGRPANLPLWLEHGTVNAAARPSMGPAAAAETPVYRKNLVDAMDRLAHETFG